MLEFEKDSSREMEGSRGALKSPEMRVKGNNHLQFFLR